MIPKAQLQRAGVTAVAVTTLASGLGALFTPVVNRLPLRLSSLAYQFHPIIIHRALSIFLGFALIYVSYQLAERRLAAWWTALSISLYLATSSVLEHGLPLVTLLAAINVMCLVLTRAQFTARSEISSLRRGILLLALSLLIATVYGVVGFYLLDERDFGREITFNQAVERTFREYTLVGNSDLVPHTRYARGFLDSIDFIGIVGLGFGLYSLFRPLSYSLRILPMERQAIMHLLTRYGDLSEGHLKLWPADKSYFFTPGHAAGIAYRVNAGIALAIGTPIGSPASRRACIDAFTNYCRNNGWDPVFVLISERGLDLFESGWRRFKAGEEAMVSLNQFAAEVATNKHFRNIRNRFTKQGCRFEVHQAPHNSTLLTELNVVSQAWLRSGKKQWGFLQGAFEPAYLQTGPLYVVRNTENQVIAFANGTPCYVPHQATIDLMRQQPDAPSNTMDFLLMEVLLAAKAEGFAEFNLGMAPFTSEAEATNSSPEERIVQLLARLNQSFVSVDGLRQFKNKFEPTWESQYLVYRGLPTALPKIALALSRATQT
jgi:phosphatidylglycerol lysyltransferase